MHTVQTVKHCLGQWAGLLESVSGSPPTYHEGDILGPDTCAEDRKPPCVRRMEPENGRNRSMFHGVEVPYCQSGLDPSGRHAGFEMSPWRPLARKERAMPAEGTLRPPSFT